MKSAAQTCQKISNQINGQSDFYILPFVFTGTLWVYHPLKLLLRVKIMTEECVNPAQHRFTQC